MGCIFKHSSRAVAVASLCVASAFSCNAHATLVEIPLGNLSPNAMTQDFESASTGSISGTSSVFTGIGLSNVSLIGTFSPGDNLSSGFVGNSLVSRGGGAGTLTIAAPGEAMDNLNDGAGYVFDVTGLATQFAFRVVDQINNNMRIQTFNNNALLDDIAFLNTGSFPNPIRAFESDTPFDEFRIIADGFNGGWGIDDLSLSTIPEPDTLLLMGLGLAGLGYARSKKQG